MKLFEGYNIQNIKYYVKKIVDEISKYLNITGISNNFDKKTFGSLKLSVSIDYLQDYKKIEDILNKYKIILLKNDLILIYKIINYVPEDGVIKITIKNIYNDRIKPDVFVYHSSYKTYRESISEFGLLPKKHKEGNWKDVDNLEYPPAVFASGYNKWTSEEGYDTWQIDTTKIKNKWFNDLNFNKKSGNIMTFEPIPKEAIKLM